jgi:DNA-binding transcriptional LysR family regulator
MIDLAALESLRAVAHHASVNGAAQALGFTPSAVSQQVKRLERGVGVPLLERVGRGVVLTAAGQRLVRDTGELRERLERIEAELRLTAGEVAGSLQLATFSTATRGLVAPVLRRLRGDHPDLRVTLQEHEPWDTVDLVATGRVDLGLAHSWGDLPLTVPSHVRATDVARDVADVLVPVDHPLAGREVVRPTDLREVDWVATANGTICRQWLSRMYVGTGTSPRIVHEAAEYESHIAVVAAGLAVALVPRLGRAVLPPEVVALPVVDPVPERTVTALHRRSMDSAPAVQAFLDALLVASVADLPADAGSAPA